jgi:hypothetical protein
MIDVAVYGSTALAARTQRFAFSFASSIPRTRASSFSKAAPVTGIGVNAASGTILSDSGIRRQRRLRNHTS